MQWASLMEPGGAQSYTVNAVARPTWSKGFPSGNGTIILGGSTGTLRITVDNPASIALNNFSFTDVFPPVVGAGRSSSPRVLLQQEVVWVAASGLLLI